MVLDINLIRQKPEFIKNELRKRFKDEKQVDLILDIDEQWRKERFNNDELNKLKNNCSKVIKDKKKAKEADGDKADLPEDILQKLTNLTVDDLKQLNVLQIKQTSKELDKEIEKCLLKRQELEDKRNELVTEIPNILHPDVVISKDEKENGLIRMFGDTTTVKKYSHIDLIRMVDGVNFKMGQRNSGSRCYYLQDSCFWLENALMQFAYQVMHGSGYKAISPPVFMNKDAMKSVSQLSQFDEELYKVVCRRSEEPDDVTEEEKYLIATSEQAIAALNRDTWLPKSELPIKYLGVSECFRQEVGSHGRDTRGIFRVHQFKKVEQFCITSPYDGESEKMFQEMIGHSEEFYQKLNIPYRVVSIVSGELNNAASIKYDLEGWFPGQGAFRELVSCSNCTDYQARSVLTHYGETKQLNKEAEYVHMLNSTLCATTRVVCAVLENYQTDTGVRVPEVLQPFMVPEFREFIPFVKE